MLTTVQAARVKDDSGAHIPTVFPAFEKHEVVIRRGHLHLIAAAPGTFKSVVASNLVIGSGVGSQYIGMDIDPSTWATRALKAIGGIVSGAEQAVLAGDDWAIETLAQIPWVSLDFPSSPDMDEIVLRVFAYAEANGQFPELIVIDNLADIVFDADEHSGYKLIMDELTRLARLSKAAVVALHHVTGQYEDGSTSIPLSGLQYKLGKKPSLVITLNRGNRDDVLWAAIVKNRYGPADPSGFGCRVELRVQPEIMQVS